MNRSRAAFWRLLAVLAVLGLLAAACGDDGDGEETSDTSLLNTDDGDGEGDDPDDAVEPQYGGTIHVGLEAESNTWTPGPAQLASPGLTVAMTIYDPLVSLNDEGEFEGFLAESIEPNDDLTQWTLTLRDGVQFHDGTPLDAETLKWNFDTLHNVDTSQTYGTLQSAGVENMEVVDDLTVVYNLSEPNAAFPDILRLEAGWPVSREAYEADPEGFGDAPVGTGPFMMEEWIRDSETRVVRNPDYWMTDPDTGEQLPYLDEIVFRPITDEDSRVQSLASDTIQVMQTLRGSAVKQVLSLVDEGGYDSNIYVGNESGSAILNVLEPPLDDVRIRTALAYAGDPYQVQEVLGDDGLTEPNWGFFSADSPWYSEAAASAYPGFDGRDVEQATALVDEYRNDPNRSDGKAAGDDVVVQYNCPGDPTLVQVSQLQQALWQEVGVVTNLQQVEQAQHITNAVGSPDTDPPFRGDYVINCWRAGGGTGDPLTALQSFFGPVETTPGNFTNFTHPVITEQLDVLQTNADFEVRYDAVEQIGLIAAEEVPILWSSPTPTIVGYVDDLHGIPDWQLPSGSLGTGTPGARSRYHQAFLAE